MAALPLLLWLKSWNGLHCRADGLTKLSVCLQDLLSQGGKGMRYGSDRLRGQDLMSVRRLAEAYRCRALLHLQRVLRRPLCFQFGARRWAVDF